MRDTDYIQEPASIEAIRVRSRELEFTMASEPRTGALLKALAATRPGGRLLELGTGTGVGTAWLLAGMDTAATLTSVDVDPTFQVVAREMLGADPRLTLVVKDAAKFVRTQPPASYDLIFADAMAGKYEALDETLALLKPGGLYIIDDLLPQPNWLAGHAAKVPALLNRLKADECFALTTMEWASGVAIAVRKSE